MRVPLPYRGTSAYSSLLMPLPRVWRTLGGSPEPQVRESIESRRGEMMKRPTIWTAGAFAGLAIAVGPWLLEKLRVDGCLDSGRVYDYRNERCFADVLASPVIAYSKRHPVRWNGGFGLAAVSILGGISALALRTKRHGVQ